MSKQQLYYEDVSVGDEIPPVTDSVSEVQMFFFSAATNNGHRIHYDLPYAQSEGLPTILVHGPLQAALIARTITDWIGPAGRLTSIDIQNRGSAVPHQEITFGGLVKEKIEKDGQYLVTCEIFERNDADEVLMPGSATVSLPSRAD